MSVSNEDMTVVLEAIQLLCDAGERGRLETIMHRAVRSLDSLDTDADLPPIPKDMKALYSKYHVRDANGESLDSGTFVLRPFNADGTMRDINAAEALNTYAELVEVDNAELHESIMAWLDNPVDHPATKGLNVPGCVE